MALNFSNLITDSAWHGILHWHFRPLQNLKWVTAKWLTRSWQTITRGSCLSKTWKPPSSRPISIYFEFRSKPSLITVICMDPHSPNKLFATKYCFLILGDEFLFLNHFFIFRFFFLFYVILLLLIFTKTMLLLSFYLIIFFFMKITFIFSCSGMFRNVPCSGFYRRPMFD